MRPGLCVRQTPFRCCRWLRASHLDPYTYDRRVHGRSTRPGDRSTTAHYQRFFRPTKRILHPFLLRLRLFVFFQEVIASHPLLPTCLHRSIYRLIDKLPTPSDSRDGRAGDSSQRTEEVCERGRRFTCKVFGSSPLQSFSPTHSSNAPNTFRVCPISRPS